MKTTRMAMSALAAMVFSLHAAPALTPEEADRISTLEKMVEALQVQIQQLQHSLQSQPAPAAAAPALENRVAALEKRVDDPKAMNVSWQNGLTFQSNDKAFKLQLGGRIQADAAYFGDQDPGVEEAASGGIEDGAEFRRTRLELGGTIYEKAEFKLQYDFSDGVPGFRYVYAGLQDLPGVGTLRVGHMQEPFGMEQLNSSKYITFLERGLPSAFTPSYNTGVMFFEDALEQRMTYSAGLFRETDDFGRGKSGDGYHSTARLTALPVYGAEGRQLVHLGVAGSLQSTSEGKVRYRSRPENHIAPFFVDTKEYDADDVDLLGFEAASVFGSLSFQAEYMTASTKGPEQDADFSGYYGMVSYFLSGEHRPYLRREGYFGRVIPAHNYRTAGGGVGAWELALRVSGIDLNDGEIAGGEMQDYSGGVNWYLNPNMRIMLNYILADLEDAGDSEAVTARWQVDF